MKKYLLPLLLLIVSCSPYEVEMSTYTLTVKITGMEGVDNTPVVKVRDQQSNVFTSTADENGLAQFILPAGVYEASISEVVESTYFKEVYNAVKSGIVVGEKGQLNVEIPVSATVIQTSNPVLIKEIYVFGCQKDDGSGKFTGDKCIILYNNSSQPVSLATMAIGMVEPYNAEAGSHNFLRGGVLLYEQEDWMPGINGIWYFDSSAEIAPYSELVIAVNGAIDHTISYSNSVSYAKSDYYCMYDPEASSSDGSHYNNTLYYPSPSEVIPTNHYLKAVKYGKGTAWPISQTSPAVFIFNTEGTTPKEYASDDNNIVYPPDMQGNKVYACLRVPRAWIIDGVEVFNSDAVEKSKKRMTSDVDNGYVKVKAGYGHSVMRKIDEKASAKSGHDVYVDTNNSTNDFYETDRCSIR